jgi:hypothetical protein
MVERLEVEMSKETTSLFSSRLSKIFSEEMGSSGGGWGFELSRYSTTSNSNSFISSDQLLTHLWTHPEFPNEFPFLFTVKL